MHTRPPSGRGWSTTRADCGGWSSPFVSKRCARNVQTPRPERLGSSIGFPLRGSLRNSALRLRAAPSPCGAVLRCALPRGRSAWAEGATNRRPATTVDSPRRLSLDTGEAARSLSAPRPRAVSSARPSERSAPHCHEASTGTPGPIHPSPCRVGALLFHRNAVVGLTLYLAANAPTRIERHRVMRSYRRAYEMFVGLPTVWPRVALPPSPAHRISR
jgi:hypothetical protein